MNFFLKPSDYEAYIEIGVEKIIKTIDSCTTDDHLNAAKTMIDNFILVLLLNDNFNEEEIQFVSKQLYLYLNTTKSNIIKYASY
jgi:hypothetical protein